jgi:hypothetical protein
VSLPGRLPLHVFGRFVVLHLPHRLRNSRYSLHRAPRYSPVAAPPPLAPSCPRAATSRDKTRPINIQTYHLDRLLQGRLLALRPPLPGGQRGFPYSGVRVRIVQLRLPVSFLFRHAQRQDLLEIIERLRPERIHLVQGGHVILSQTLHESVQLPLDVDVSVVLTPDLQVAVVDLVPQLGHLQLVQPTFLLVFLLQQFDLEGVPVCRNRSAVDQQHRRNSTFPRFVGCARPRFSLLTVLFLTVRLSRPSPPRPAGSGTPSICFGQRVPPGPGRNFSSPSCCFPFVPSFWSVRLEDLSKPKLIYRLSWSRKSNPTYNDSRAVKINLTGICQSNLVKNAFLILNFALKDAVFDKIARKFDSERTQNSINVI